MELVKKQNEMAVEWRSLKEDYRIFVKYEVCIYNYKINFNFTEIWSQF